jgi:hypothetical protein
LLAGALRHAISYALAADERFRSTAVSAFDQTRAGYGLLGVVGGVRLSP